MPHALNMTMPLKQDAKSQEALEELKKNFAGGIQQIISDALAKSEIVHFARILIIDNKYIQILTEYDGDKRDYALFFLKELPNVFESIFGLVEGAPLWTDLQKSADLFVETSKNFDLRALGTKVDDDEAGWLFSALGNKTVEDIKKALAK
ncbi:MAG: hypothetical protein RR184_09275 [Citrobacter sp.]|uniref:Uncharacterized protein n=1 Tax=Citrobacter tructae TaxID=2562449 RepID=A0ABX5T107_9ENTR|nr:hypothetical protein [Citrobacter tructae]QBX80095.1 hypothetical protein E4Z61_06880 [Citrobacter tructae]